MNRTAYACLVFNVKTRRVEGWSIYSAPGDQITCLGERVCATIMSAEGDDYEDARRIVERAMEQWLPGIPPDERIVAVDSEQEAKMVRQAMQVSRDVAWMLRLISSSADEEHANNFASVTIGGLHAPWDRATLTLHRPGGKAPEEVVQELMDANAALERKVAALEAHIVEMSETDPGR